MPRPTGSAEVLQERRWRAMAMVDEGYSLTRAARIIGCEPSSVMRWRDARRRGGDEALKVRFSPGRPPRLTRKQKKRLVQLLLKGATAFGYTTQLWTTARIAELICREFEVSYHPDHVGRLMHSLDWTPQKPERRATERKGDKEIERWKAEDWPRVKKTPRGWVPTSSSATNPASF